VPGQLASGNVRVQGGRGQQDEAMTIVLFDGNTAIFASSQDRARNAVELLQGNAASLDGQNSELLANRKEGMIIYGAAQDLESIGQRDGLFPILSQHERIYWSVGAQGDEVHQDLILIAKSEDVAEEMSKALEGLTALGKVWANDSDNMKKLMDEREIVREGNQVHLKGRGDSATVMGALADVRDRVMQGLEAVNDAQ
jgi:hypothetical protein